MPTPHVYTLLRAAPETTHKLSYRDVESAKRDSNFIVIQMRSGRTVNIEFQDAVKAQQEFEDNFEFGFQVYHEHLTTIEGGTV